MTGQPLVEAQTAAREFLAKCDFTTMEVGLISFSTLVGAAVAGDQQRAAGCMRPCTGSRRREART